MNLKKVAGILGLIFLTGNTVGSKAFAGTAVIDATQTYQFIRGFGASSAWHTSAYTTAQATDFWDSTNTVVNAGVTSAAGVGLSMLRCHIPYDNPTTGTTVTDTGELAVMHQAQSLGCNQIWATEWSAPAAFKSNNNVDNGGTLLTADYAAYAQYLLNYAKMCEANGVTLICISPQNEPDMNVSYESGIWTGQLFHDFISQSMGPTFTGNPTQIMMPEPSHNALLTMGCAADGDANCTLNDANAAKYVSFLGTHLYYSSVPAAFANLQLNDAPGVTREFWETEIYDQITATSPDPSMGSGLFLASLLHNSIAAAGMNAFHYWWLQSSGNDNGGLIQADGTLTKRLYVMGNWSRFVRPGSYRISATANPSAGVTVSAYKNTLSGQYVIVAINGSNAVANQTFTLNGITSTLVTPWVTGPNDNLTQKAPVAVAAGSFTYSMPVSSVVSFVGTTSSFGPTATPTNTLPPTPTPTATNTPIPGAYCMVDDFPTNSATNLWGGTWGDYQDAGSSLTFAVTAGGSGAPSNYSAAVNGTIGTGGYGGLSCPLSAGTTDLSNYVGVAFDVKGNGGTYWFQVLSATVTTGDHYGMTFTAPAAWTPVTVYFNAIAQRGFGNPPQPFGQNQVSGLQWANSSTGAMNFQVDNVRVIGNYCAGTILTSTPTPTATRTATATATPTLTLTKTQTVTTTPSFTATLSPTVTLTRSPTATLTPTWTASPTVTKTVTVTPTQTFSPTVTLTAPFTSTATPTTTSSPTVTKTTTQTPTASPTLTVSATATQTLSPTLTFTLVPGATNTWTESPTATPTLTTTPTLTMSPSPTTTPTNTKTPTATPSVTSTATATPTKTSTSSPTFTSTPAATASPTASATPTPQATLSLSLSAAPLAVAPDDFMTYTIQLVISNGNSNSTVVILNLPTDVTVSGYTTGPGGSISGNQVFWTLGTLTPGTYTFGVEVTVAGGASGTLSAQAGVSAPAGEIFSNSASVTVTPFTATPTATTAVTPVSNPVLYPNPVTGPGPILIRLPNYPGLADISVKVYTTAFRLVDKFTANQKAGGSDLSLPLTDQGGMPLANGLYYAVVTTPLGRSIEKLLIIR
jgi:glucuronoarabinoxylan endo-1,4-beta-xylanase